MIRSALTLAALAGALFAAPFAAATDAPAWDGCVQYAYVADYHWYWVCVAPKDLSCPVYFKEQHGVTVTKSCVVESGGVASPEVTCIPTSGGLDYPSFLCVDAGDARCPVYTITTSDWGVRKTCYPPL
jgi:hypothetical protein